MEQGVCWHGFFSCGFVCCFEMDMVVRDWVFITLVCNLVFLDCFLRCELCRHHEQHTAATMHHRCRHMTHAILLLILYICCVARAVFMIFCALPVPHTLQATPSATPVALRCRHLWSILFIWKDCISKVSLFHGAGCLLRWFILLMILCCCFEFDMVVKKGALIALV